MRNYVLLPAYNAATDSWVNQWREWSKYVNILNQESDSLINWQYYYNPKWQILNNQSDTFISQWNASQYNNSIEYKKGNRVYVIVNSDKEFYECIAKSAQGISPSNTNYWKKINNILNQNNDTILEDLDIRRAVYYESSLDGKNKGAYDDDETYYTNQVVYIQDEEQNRTYYKAIQETTGHTPPNSTYWESYSSLDSLFILQGYIYFPAKLRFHQGIIINHNNIMNGYAWMLDQMSLNRYGSFITANEQNFFIMTESAWFKITHAAEISSEDYYYGYITNDSLGAEDPPSDTLYITTGEASSDPVFEWNDTEEIGDGVHLYDGSNAPSGGYIITDLQFSSQWTDDGTGPTSGLSFNQQPILYSLKLGNTLLSLAQAESFDNDANAERLNWHNYIMYAVANTSIHIPHFNGKIYDTTSASYKYNLSFDLNENSEETFGNIISLSIDTYNKRYFTKQQEKEFEDIINAVASPTYNTYFNWNYDTWAQLSFAYNPDHSINTSAIFIRDRVKQICTNGVLLCEKQVVQKVENTIYIDDFIGDFAEEKIISNIDKNGYYYYTINMKNGKPINSGILPKVQFKIW